MTAVTPVLAKFIAQANAHARANAGSPVAQAAAEFARGLPALMPPADRGRVLEHYTRVHRAITAETEDLTGLADGLAAADPARDAARRVDRAVLLLAEAQAALTALRTARTWAGLDPAVRSAARTRLVAALRDANTQLMLLVQSEGPERQPHPHADG